MKANLITVSLIALMLVAAENLSAQKVTIKWSEDFVEEKGETLGQVIYDDGTHIYMRVDNKTKQARGKGNVVTPGILKLDLNMKPVARENYSSDIDDLVIRGLFYFDGQFVMLTSKYDKASNTTEIFGVPIDIATLKPRSGAVSLWKVGAPPKKDFYWDASISDDSTRLLLVATFDQKKDEKERFAYKVVDKSLKSVNDKMVELNYKSSDFSILNYKVSAAGDLYVFAKGYREGAKSQTERGENKTRVASYEIVILKYGVDGAEKEYRIPMGEKVMDTYALATDPSGGDLFVFGTYQAATEDGVIGYFFNRIDSKTGDVKVAKTQQFPISFIDNVNRLNDDKSKGKSPGISKYFNITDLMVMPDNRIYAIIEKRYSVVQTTKYGSYTTYHSNSIIATQLDKEGNQVWINHIPKSQFFNSLTAYIYYSTMVYKDKLLIFYNDIDKNLTYNINTEIGRAHV